MFRFTFSESPPGQIRGKGIDPQLVGEELERLTREAKGRLTPIDVVEAARNRRNVLHKCFEWDDRIAAEKYRLDQARELIRIVRRVDDEDDDEAPQRVYLSVSDDGRAYRSIDEVLSSHDLQLAVMQAAEKELRAFEHRFSELEEICSIVRNARAQLAARIQRSKGKGGKGKGQEEGEARV